MTTVRHVVEELTITIDAERREAYLARDAEVWTPYLEACDGFLGKETWLPDDQPDTIVFIIRWASTAQWKSITPEQVAAVDRRMGDLQPTTLSCRSYQASSAQGN
mgnify:CR=1 FL=1